MLIKLSVRVACKQIFPDNGNAYWSATYYPFNISEYGKTREEAETKLYASMNIVAASLHEEGKLESHFISHEIPFVWIAPDKPITQHLNSERDLLLHIP